MEKIENAYIDKVIVIKLKNTDLLFGKLLEVTDKQIKLRVMFGKDKDARLFSCWYDKSEIYWWGVIEEVVTEEPRIIKTSIMPEKK